MRFSVKSKLFLSFGIILAILIGLGIFAYIGAGQMNQKADELNDVWLLGVDVAHTINSLVYEYRTKEYRYIASASVSASNEDFAAIDEDFKAIKADAEKEIKIYRDTAILPEDIRNSENIKAAWENYLQVSQKVIKLAKEKKVEEGMELMLKGESIEAFDKVRSATSEVVKFNQEYGAKANNESKRIYSSIKVTLIVFIVLALLLGTIMAWFISTNISKSINKLLNVSENVANGDLTKKISIKSKDELGQLAVAFNSMIDRLRELVLKISESAEQLAASSQELTASSEQSSKATEQIANATQTVASGAERQLSSVEEAADSISQVSVGLNQIAKNSQSMTKFAQKSVAASDQGMATVNAVVNQMKEIDNTISITANVIKSLDKQSIEIGKIVEMITDITNKTNLLSLNAAIEAAKAGEAGRGFAVVADEVRKLAEQSKVSATQITDLIRNIREETSNAVVSIGKGTEKVAEGIGKSEQVSQTFKEIQESIQSVDIQIQEVSSATEQILAESNNIVKAIDIVEKAAEQGNHASQENAAASQEQLATMEEISSAAQSLSKSAEDLNSLVAQFKIK